MTFDAKAAGRLAAAAMLAAALAACASKPKPTPVADTGPSGVAHPARRARGLPRAADGRRDERPGPPGLDPGLRHQRRRPGLFRLRLLRRSASDATPVLDAQASWLQRYPAVRVRIEGNADERGTREYNFALGARRAQAVADYLVGRGVNRGRITTVSYGKERPIDAGSSEEAHGQEPQRPHLDR